VRRTSVLIAVVAMAVATASCSSNQAAPGTRTSRAAHSTRPAALTGPKTTPLEDTRYLADVAKADPALAAYVDQRGNVALRALLTDGSAFCAFLHSGQGLDEAIYDVALGARSVESQTHLPASVANYNTIEALALLNLCPSEQALVPTSVRDRIHRLGQALGPSSA